jgi:hypothetical protein
MPRKSNIRLKKVASEWLKKEDETGRAGRIERAMWQGERMPQPDVLLFHGGPISKFLFEEMRYSFVYAQFLAAIVLGVSFIEHTLASLFYQFGRNDLEKTSLSTLLKEAVSVGWIDEDDFNRIDHARQIRNAVLHFRKPGDEESIEFRSINLESVPYQVLEEDAKQVLKIALDLFGKFSIN